MRKQPKAPTGKKSQILIFHWLYFTEASCYADMGKNIIFMFFAFFMSSSFQASELCSLDCTGLIPLKLFSPPNINHRMYHMGQKEQDGIFIL